MYKYVHLTHDFPRTIWEHKPRARVIKLRAQISQLRAQFIYFFYTDGGNRCDRWNLEQANASLPHWFAFCLWLWTYAPINNAKKCIVLGFFFLHAHGALSKPTGQSEDGCLGNQLEKKSQESKHRCRDAGMEAEWYLLTVCSNLWVWRTNWAPVSPVRLLRTSSVRNN